MHQPQSQDEVEPVVRALQGIDHLLDVVWNPKAQMIAPGAYSALGVATPPSYDGRWQVIRYDTHNWHNERTINGRQYCVIVTVTETYDADGIRCMVKNGAYAPIGPWLIDYMHAADAQNVKAMTAIREKLWGQDDALEAADDAESDAMFRDALDKTHFDAVHAGGVGNWQGKGMDFTQPKE